MHATKCKTVVVAQPLQQATEACGRSSDDIGEQTSKHTVSRSVLMSTSGLIQRRMLADSQIVVQMAVWAACCVLTWIRMVFEMLCPGYLQ